MKNILMILALALGSPAAFAADLGLSASSLKIKVFKFAVSKSELCTNLITVVDNGSTPVEVDMVGLPKIGKGKLPKGTYPCVVIEFEDHIKFKPSALSTTGNCNPASADAELDVCRSGSDQSVLVDGSITTCSTASNRVAMYLSTASTGSGGGGADAFNAPTSSADPLHGFPLTSALVVTGSTAGKFVVNPAGKVCDGADAGCDGGGAGSVCRLEPPTFGFTKN